MSLNKCMIILVLLFVLLPKQLSASNLNSSINEIKKLKVLVNEEASPEWSRSDKVRVLVLFKACCSPNDSAMRWAVAAHDKFEGQLEFVGINLDRPRSLSKVKSWLLSRDVIFTVLSDPTASVLSGLQVVIPPAVILFSPDGSEVKRTMGFQSNDKSMLNKEIEHLLNSIKREKTEEKNSTGE